MDIKNNPDKAVIHLKGHLDLGAIAILKVLLKNLLEQSKPVVLEAKTITEVDAAGIQLLLDFCITAEKNGLTWYWQEPSAPLLNTAMLLGAQQYLKLDAPGGFLNAN